MPVFSPEQVTTPPASHTFSPQEVTGGGPPDSDVATQARARLKARGTSPEYVKMSPATATKTEDPTGLRELFFGDTYGDSTPLKTKDGGFVSNFAQAMNPFSWAVPPIAEALAPTNSVFGGVTDPRAAESSSAGYNPTIQNWPDRMSNTLLPHPIDIVKESYRRGESGESTKGMYGAPLAMAVQLGAAHALPPTIKLVHDIADENSLRLSRSAGGSSPDNFGHGSTPDIAINKQGFTATQGRLYKSLQDSHSNEMGKLDRDLTTPDHEAQELDPMKSVRPVIKDATSRALNNETVEKIGTFTSNLMEQAKSLVYPNKNGLSVKGLNQLRRWVDGYITAFKDEPDKTSLNLAQNVRSALRAQIDSEAPEVTGRNQHIQSYIDAEEDLFRKIHTPVPRAETAAAMVRNAAGSVFPETAFKTGSASFLNMIKRPTSWLLGADNAPEGWGNTGRLPSGGPQDLPSSSPQPPPLAGFESTDQGHPLPAPIGIMALPPNAPGIMQARTAAAQLGAEPPPGMPPATPQFGPDTNSSFGGRLTGVSEPPISTKDWFGQKKSPDLTTATTANDFLRTDAGAKAGLNKPPRGPNTPMEPPPTGTPPADLTKGQMLAQGISRGMELSGRDENGNLVAGKATVDPFLDTTTIPNRWKVDILDTRSGRPLRANVDDVSNKITGPAGTKKINPLASAPVEKTAAPPAQDLADATPEERQKALEQAAKEKYIKRFGKPPE